MAQARRWHPLALIALLLALLGVCPSGAWAGLVHAPRWQELTPVQKQFLTPIRGEWNALDDARRFKWIGIADQYPKMTPDEQARISARLQAWVKLTPEQRKKARETYKRLSQLPGDQRPALAEKWGQYLALPPEEKARLRTPAAQIVAPPNATNYKRIPAEWLIPPYLRATAAPASQP